MTCEEAYWAAMCRAFGHAYDSVEWLLFLLKATAVYSSSAAAIRCRRCGYRLELPQEKRV
jgi:hypothetical protein